jgi:hypothetical protein
MLDSVSARDRFADKVARGIFKPVGRHLREDIREDRLAEGVALTFEMFARSAERGLVIDDALLVHHCRLRAIDLSRRVAGADGGQPKRDVLDERNYTDGTLEVLHLGLEFGEDDGGVGYAAAMVNNPTSHILSALNLESWLDGLDEEDRLLLALRHAGHTLNEIGLQLAASTSTVCARLHALGHELAARIGRAS